MEQDELNRKLKETFNSLPRQRKQKARWGIIKLCLMALFRPALFRKYYPKNAGEQK